MEHEIVSRDDGASLGFVQDDVSEGHGDESGLQVVEEDLAPEGSDSPAIHGQQRWRGDRYRRNPSRTKGLQNASVEVPHARMDQGEAHLLVPSFRALV